MSLYEKKTIAHYTDRIINSPMGLLIISFLTIAMGILFIVMQIPNKPIQRREAVAYSGELVEYETSRNYCGINFKDGTTYEVYPHTETGEFREKMKSLPKGTRLYLLVNPNNDYVVEIKTATEELLNFEKSQQDIAKYDNGYIVIGAVCCIGGVVLIFFAFGMKKNKRIEEQRAIQRKAKTGGMKINSAALRYADMSVKSKVLLKVEVGKYNICYRRVKTVNELVVNGVVYDEKRVLFEFEHKLCATIDCHEIEAGLDENSYSYINFDGEIVKCKKRLI